MNNWAVDIEFRTDKSIEAEELMERQGSLMDLSAVGIWKRDAMGGGFDLAIDIDGDSMDAANYATQRVRAALDGYDLQITAIRVITWEQFEAEHGAAAVPDLVSIAQAAEIAGISRQRAHQLYKAGGDFPAVVQETKQGPLVLRSAAEHWAKTRNKKSGRRPKTSASS